MALVRVVYIYMRVICSCATAAAVTKIEFLSKGVLDKDNDA